MDLGNLEFFVCSAIKIVDKLWLNTILCTASNAAKHKNTDY
jgi:hypothetical protein